MRVLDVKPSDLIWKFIANMFVVDVDATFFVVARKLGALPKLVMRPAEKCLFVHAAERALYAGTFLLVLFVMVMGRSTFNFYENGVECERNHGLPSWLNHLLYDEWKPFNWLIDLFGLKGSRKWWVCKCHVKRFLSTAVDGCCKLNPFLTAPPARRLRRERGVGVSSCGPATTFHPTHAPPPPTPRALLDLRLRAAPLERRAPPSRARGQRARAAGSASARETHLCSGGDGSSAAPRSPRCGGSTTATRAAPPAGVVVARRDEQLARAPRWRGAAEDRAASRATPRRVRGAGDEHDALDAARAEERLASRGLTRVARRAVRAHDARAALRTRAAPPATRRRPTPRARRVRRARALAQRVRARARRSPRPPSRPSRARRAPRAASASDTPRHAAARAARRVAPHGALAVFGWRWNPCTKTRGAQRRRRGLGLLRGRVSFRGRVDLRENLRAHAPHRFELAPQRGDLVLGLLGAELLVGPRERERVKGRGARVRRGEGL